MAKLFIVDNNIKSIKNIQRQFQSINKHFSESSTFCFVQKGNRIVLLSLSDVIAQSVHQKVYFYDEEPAVLDALSEFIFNYENESIMILISGMLISATNAMTVENYESAYEYSCSLYYHLMKWKNVFAKNVYFIMYSPSSISASTIAKELSELYKENEKDIFPMECCLPQNVSWCKSSHLTDYNSTIEKLVLPTGYSNFIASLN